jgi:two-component system, NtrC family, sensor kinase
MNVRVTDSAVSTAAATPPTVRVTLFRKYLMLFVAVVSVALIANGIFEVWFDYREQKTLLIAIQHEQAAAAADKISRFIKEIEDHIGWTTQLPWTPGDLEDRKVDAQRLMHQMKAIDEFAQFDRLGREQLRRSRRVPDRNDSDEDFFESAWFNEVIANNVYYGPVYYRDESEPYMSLAMAGDRSDAAVSFAEINLKFVWDVVTQIKIGARGQAYVVDGEGRLIAHPDMSLMLRRTNLSHLAQVRAALRGGSEPSEPVQEADDVNGRRVLTAYAPVAPLGWMVFVELPIDEAYSPIYASIERSGALLLAALALAFLASLFLARNMVRPIRALSRVAASWRRWGINSTAWRPSFRTPMPRWSARSRSAPISSNSPTLPNRAFSLRQATICASRSMPWVCSSRNCTPRRTPPNGGESSSGSMPR